MKYTAICHKWSKHAGNTEWIFGCLLHDECPCTVCLFVQSNTASDFRCAGDRHMVTHGDTCWHTVKLSFPIKNGAHANTAMILDLKGASICSSQNRKRKSAERPHVFQQTECFPTIVPFSLQPYVAPQVLRYQLQKQTTWLFWRTMRLCSGFDGGLWANSRTLECLAAKKPLRLSEFNCFQVYSDFWCFNRFPAYFLTQFRCRKAVFQ